MLNRYFIIQIYHNQCLSVYFQLKQVNLALQTCSDENKEELLSLKNSLEELISLTFENYTNSVESQENDGIDDEYALFMVISVFKI